MNLDCHDLTISRTALLIWQVLNENFIWPNLNPGFQTRQSTGIGAGLGFSLSCFSLLVNGLGWAHWKDPTVVCVCAASGR